MGSCEIKPPRGVSIVAAAPTGEFDDGRFHINQWLPLNEPFFGSRACRAVSDEITERLDDIWLPRWGFDGKGAQGAGTRSSTHRRIGFEHRQPLSEPIGGLHFLPLPPRDVRAQSDDYGHN